MALFRCSDDSGLELLAKLSSVQFTKSGNALSADISGQFTDYANITIDQMILEQRTIGTATVNGCSFTYSYNPNGTITISCTESYGSGAPTVNLFDIYIFSEDVRN